MTLGVFRRMAAVAGAMMLLAATTAPAMVITILDPTVDARRVIPGFSYSALAFAGNDLYAANGSSICHFANAANLPIGATLSIASARCGTSNVGLTSLAYDGQGTLYGFGGGSILKIDTATFQATSLPNSAYGGTHGFAIDPRDGAIFYSSVATGKIFRYDPFTQNAGMSAADALFFDAGAAGLGGLHRMTILPDGTIVVGSYTQNKLLVLSGYSGATPTGTLIAAKPLATGATVTAVTYAAGDVYLGFSSGRISRVDLNAPIYTETALVGNAGGYIEDAAISPNGHIWYSAAFSGALGTLRLTQADGSGFLETPEPPPATAPTPNAVLLIGSGLAALFLTRRRTRRADARA